MKEFSLVYHFANKENRCICCDKCEGDDCTSDPEDPFERGPCSEACFEEYQDFKDRGYKLLGIEDKEWEGLTFKQFVNLEVKTSWADTEDVLEAPSYIEYERFEQGFENVLSELTWYDRSIFEMVSSGKKISVLSRETNINYVSLWNTYKKLKKHIKNKIENYDWYRGFGKKGN